MQKNKTTDITIKTMGKANIAALPRHEQEVFFSTVFKHINALIQGGENK